MPSEFLHQPTLRDDQRFVAPAFQPSDPVQQGQPLHAVLVDVSFAALVPRSAYGTASERARAFTLISPVNPPNNCCRN
jgi:hypothetical protein